MKDYVTLSLETHLFFSRIMKEHALFLQAGFVGKDVDWIQKADWFRQQFEDFLRQVVEISNGRIGNCVIHSNELATEFTIPAETKTHELSGIPIDSNITTMEQQLQPGMNRNRGIIPLVRNLNVRAVQLLNGFIQFKENILEEVTECRLFTANYPLLIKHIIREAKLYRSMLIEIMNNRQVSRMNLCAQEEFWNQIMMEHALFIRGLLDPSEEELIKTADGFAMDYKELLEQAKQKDCRAESALTGRTLEQTLKYRDFKAAGAKGILDCQIASIILPLLADHVLREANHYIRILDCHELSKEG